MKSDRVSLPKPKYKLCELDDDEDVFTTSMIDRYAARPKVLANMCLAELATSYDLVASGFNGDDGVDCPNNLSGHDDQQFDVTDGRAQTLHTGRICQKQEDYKSKGWIGIYVQKEKTSNIENKTVLPYYHAKLLLHYPWVNEDMQISGHVTYKESYLAKYDTIVPNAKKM